MTFKITLDSSIIISHLIGDIHKTDVMLAIERLGTLNAETLISLVCYAEIWTGIEWVSSQTERGKYIVELEAILAASRIQLVSDNVAIAREAARAQAEYRQRGGRREHLIPDFLIGANASHYTGRLLTTNPRDFLKYFPFLEVLTPQSLLQKYPSSS